LQKIGVFFANKLILICVYVCTYISIYISMYIYMNACMTGTSKCAMTKWLWRKRSLRPVPGWPEYSLYYLWSKNDASLLPWKKKHQNCSYFCI
jgi:hypothetical protein